MFQSSENFSSPIVSQAGYGPSCNLSSLVGLLYITGWVQGNGSHTVLYCHWLENGRVKRKEPQQTTRDIPERRTGVFRKAAQALVRPCALILGERLYGAKISVEYYLYLFPYTVRPTLYRVWKLFRYLCLRSRLYCAPNMDYTYNYCAWILCACVAVQTQAICNCRIIARAVIWSTSYFPNVSIFLLTALGDLPENPVWEMSTVYTRILAASADKPQQKF